MPLTEEQRDIVESIGWQPLLVLAGPGTGKTEVPSHGILHLLSNKLATKEEIAGITFTTKAAQQMKKRLFELGLEFNSQPLICTLHSLSMRMLKDRGSEIGISEDFILADGYESELILDDAICDVNPGAIRKTKEFSNRILLLKCENEELSDISDGLSKKLFIRYQEILRFHSTLDFQDLVIQACRLLSKSEEAKNFYQAKAKYLLVDEFQDINKAEYSLINHLAGSGTGLFVVGDDKQSIYSWRGIILK
jgi:superfamily I DNA/RNA helicase